MFIVSLFNNGNNSCVEFRNIDYYFFKSNFVFFDIFYVWVNEIVFILVKGIKVKFFVKWKYIEILKIVMIKLYLDLD